MDWILFDYIAIGTFISYGILGIIAYILFKKYLPKGE